MLSTEKQTERHVPVISFVVPCFNSADYMERCIKTLIPGDDRGEIIIVDDGSTDATGTLADAWHDRYPDHIRVIHKANGGHGSAVNAGLDAAEGRYFKVVDSDDWLDEKSLETLLARMTAQSDGEQPVDLFICNYVYDHLNEGRQKSMGYRRVFPNGRVVGWQEIGHFSASQYLIMHALFFRTAVLREAGVVLPLHTFYVDNIFANKPLADVQTLCYLDVDCYHYFLGRDDQSVNEAVMMERIDQQIFVTKYLLDCVDLKKARAVSPKLERYLVRNISIMLSISDIHLELIGDDEAADKQRAMWRFVRLKDPVLYKWLKYHTLSTLTNLPGKTGRRVTICGYKIAQRLFKFN